MRTSRGDKVPQDGMTNTQRATNADRDAVRRHCLFDMSELRDFFGQATKRVVVILSPGESCSFRNGAAPDTPSAQSRDYVASLIVSVKTNVMSTQEAQRVARC